MTRKLMVGLAALMVLISAGLIFQGDGAAASLTSRAQVQITGSLTNTAGLQSASAPLALTRAIDLANGVAKDQANVLYSSTQAIGTGATVSLDFAGGGLTDAFGAAVAPVKVKCVYLAAAAANTTTVTAMGDTNNIPFLSTKATTFALPPGAIYLYCDPSLAAVAVTAATGDILKLVNAAGATANVDVVILGTSS